MTDKMVSTVADATQTMSATKSTSPAATNHIENNNNNDLDSNLSSKSRQDSFRKDGGDSVSLSSPQSSYNSSYGSTSGQKLVNQSVVSNSSLTSLGVPGGVVTTQNISTVIRPKENNNSLQFVKIQTPELSKKAVEQIRIAEETKISKEKIKEVEEEWQNNLLNWKSKRRQQFGHALSTEQNDPFDNDGTTGGRKIKTFAEMLEQRAKSGNQLGFNLQRYIKSGDDEDDLPINRLSGQPRHSDDEIDCLTSTNIANTNCTLVVNDSSTQHRETCYKSNDNNRFDSDYEAHSSTSSGYNQTSTSKSPGSPDSIDVGQHQHDHYPPTTRHTRLPSLDKGIITPVDDLKPVTQTCDINNLNRSLVSNNNNTSVSPDEPSISIVTHLETDRLNSTLKQGFNKPPTPSFPSSDLSRVGLTSRMQDNINQVKSLDGAVNKISERNDDSDNSAYEEEDDEEQEQDKEQRQLQRIAFVAKLKAFENLTKPTTQAPKFVPAQKQAIKPPIKSTSVQHTIATKSPTKPLRVQTQSSYDASAPTCQSSQPKQGRHSSSIEPIVLSVVKPKSDTCTTKNTLADLKNNNNAILRNPAIASDEIKVSKTDNPSPTSSSEEPTYVPRGIPSQVVTGGNLVDESQSPPISTSSLDSSSGPNHRSRHLNDEFEHLPGDIGERISNIDLNSHSSKSSLSPHAPSNVRVIDNNNKLNSVQSHTMQQTASPKQVVSPNSLRGNSTYSVDYLQKQRAIEPSTEQLLQTTYAMHHEEHRTTIPESIPSGNLMAISREKQQQQKVMPQPSVCPRQNLLSQPMQQPIPKQSSRNVDVTNQGGLQTSLQPSTKQNGQPLHRQPSPKRQQVNKDNKERTVLSVSGKKRCSSCKEELGRGAAAFVVESLSLVYHTNCFRCSVCHVNLSNGFRGVDVRVHAGALHCQNCYSKDGLNYSRV